MQRQIENNDENVDPMLLLPMPLSMQTSSGSLNSVSTNSMSSSGSDPEDVFQPDSPAARLDSPSSSPRTPVSSQSMFAPAPAYLLPVVPAFLRDDPLPNISCSKTW